MSDRVLEQVYGSQIGGLGVMRTCEEATAESMATMDLVFSERYAKWEDFRKMVAVSIELAYEKGRVDAFNQQIEKIGNAFSSEVMA